MTLNRILSIIGLAAATWGLARTMLERPRSLRHPLVDLIGDRFNRIESHSVGFGIFAGVTAIVLPLGLAIWQGWARCELVRSIPATFPVLALLTLGIKFAWASLEELMFRGGLLPQLARRVGVWAGLAITAVLFSLSHLERTGSRAPDFVTLADLTLNGIGFGLAYLATRSLWLPSIWHGTKNVMIWLLYNESSLQLTTGVARVRFSGPRLWVGSASQAGLFDLIATAVVIGLLLARFRRPLLDALDWVKT